MAEKRRLNLTGSERNEFEHLHGSLTSDPTDPRFVLVDDETAELIAETPTGIPVRPSQDPTSKAGVERSNEKALERRGESTKEATTQRKRAEKVAAGEEAKGSKSAKS